MAPKWGYEKPRIRDNRTRTLRYGWYDCQQILCTDLYRDIFRSLRRPSFLNQRFLNHRRRSGDQQGGISAWRSWIRILLPSVDLVGSPLLAEIPC